MQAFRAKLKHGDDPLVRLETYVPAATKEEITSIAAAEGVSGADAAQALLQYGIQQYRLEAANFSPASLRTELGSVRGELADFFESPDLAMPVAAAAHAPPARFAAVEPSLFAGAAGAAGAHANFVAPASAAPLLRSQSPAPAPEGWAASSSPAPAPTADAPGAIADSSPKESPIAAFFRRRKGP